MTESEWVAMFAVAAALWPGSKADEHTAAAWYGEVRGIGHEDAYAAFERLGRSEEHFPSLARFLATVRAIVEARPVVRPALPAPRVKADRASLDRVVDELEEQWEREVIAFGARYGKGDRWIAEALAHMRSSRDGTQSRRLRERLGVA